MTENPFLDRYRNASNDRLLEIAVRKRYQFQEDAIAAAEQVLEERGISVADAKWKVDEQEAARRELTDLTVKAKQLERDDEIRRIAEAGRASGRCLLTGASATTEVVVYVRRDLDRRIVDGVEMSSFDVLPVSIPLSETAAEAHRPIRPPTWFLVMLLGSIAWMLLAAILFSGLEPPWLATILIVGPFGLALLAFGVFEVQQRLVVNRLFRAHPLHGELTQRGYYAVPPDRTGRPKLELYSEQLIQHRSSLSKYAERELAAMGGSEVVARMLELLDHPTAQMAAMRVLNELRAKEAIPKLTQLTRHESPEVSDLARAVLENLAGQGRG